MRRSFSMKTLAAICIAAACLVAAVPAHASTVSMRVIQPVTVGSTFNVDVLASDAFDGLPGDFLLAYGFNVFVSDSSVLEFQSATVGPLFFDAGFPGGPDVLAV